MNSSDLRNVVLLGHSGVGKTSIGESMLFLSKATDRLGLIADGNTVLDYDPEEIRRKVSLGLAIGQCMWQDRKINIIDTPGYFDFEAEQLAGLKVADTAVIVVAGDSVSVGAEKAWKMVDRRRLPRMFFVNKLNEENSDFSKLYMAMRSAFGKMCVTLQIPIFENRVLVGMVDTVKMKGYKIGPDGTFIDADIPADVLPKAETVHLDLAEAVAETSEELMDKYFSGEPFTTEEMVEGLKKSIRECTCAPVLVGAANENTGVKKLLDFIVEYLPSPVERGPMYAQDRDGNIAEFPWDPNGHPVAFVFKTIVDPFIGRLSLFKVYSGVFKSDNIMYNANKEADERFSQVYALRGKKQIPVQEIIPGDIGAVAKLSSTSTNDTLGSRTKPVKIEQILFPEPQLVQSITPKTRGDEDKIMASLAKLAEEDKTFTYGIDPETGETVIKGMGELHLDVTMNKLASRFGVAVNVDLPKIPYREAIRTKVTAEATHKKQTGGAGQYGKVVIEFEPYDGDALCFEERVVGGAVPKQFFPSVEKGLLESVKKGMLAGFPVVGLKATLVDGKYHPVDSKEVAFVSAAKMAYRDAFMRAKPVLLEPVMSISVNVPDKYMGDVIGDLNKRRGRILGMNPHTRGIQEIVAEVPLAEIQRYAIDLRAITQARGTFKTEFVRYEDVPDAIAQGIIAKAGPQIVDDD